MIGLIRVQEAEVLAIQGQHRPPLLVSEGQDQRVGDTLPGLPGLERRQNVMASEAEGLDDREREILVGV
jgi:hypothetical protein